MVSLSYTRAPRLRANQTVGIIAPASPVSKSEIAQGLHLIESFPLKVKLGNHLFDRTGYLAGSDQDRASDLHRMFSDPDIKAIFCARGGYGSARLLNRIDFDLIRDNPKILVGFSDLTGLLIALFKKSGLITIHGPVISDLPKGDSWHRLLELITASHKPCITLAHGRMVNEGKARGILIGGNLSTICSLVDTPFLPSFEGIILFLEEKGESPYRVDRMLTQLLLSGRLAQVSAVVIGQMEDCGGQETLDSLLQERLGGLKVPVVTGLPVGHGDQNVSVPLGLPALLDTDKMVLEIQEAAVV
jgi:muramoyltetrapeptide carboxypeptidase